MRREMIRKTNETEIKLSLDTSSLERAIETGCGFLDHMLDLMCHRARIGAEIAACGDTQIDFHHLTEDVGITFGTLLREIAAERGRIARYGWCLLPMDGSLVRVALDFSGRGSLYWKGEFPTQKCGDFDTELVREFFSGLAREAGLTLHIAILEADNSHHAAEAVFKGAGMALKVALKEDSSFPSTKGVLL